MNRNLYNRTKYKILALLNDNTKYYTPREIAEEIGLGLHAVEERLNQLSNGHYIWRKKEFRRQHSNRFCYRSLKLKGKRVYAEMLERIKLEEETGIEVSLNLRKPPYPKTPPALNLGKNNRIIHTLSTSDEGLRAVR